MVIELVLDVLLGLLTLVLEAIPDATLPVIATNALNDLATEIGGALGGLDGMLPISEVAVFVVWVLGTYVPIVAAYKVSVWVWGHLPVIGNGS